MNEEQTPAGGGISLSVILLAVFRHRRWVLGGLAAGLGVAFLFWLFTAPIYRSEARLLVRYIAEKTLLDGESAGGRVVTLDRQGENVINSELELLLSADLAAKVVEAVGLEAFGFKAGDAEGRSDALLMLARNLHVEVPKRSNVMRVAFDSHDPALSQRVLSTLVELYLKRHIEIHRSSAAYDFIAQQTDQIRAKLAETEAELRKLKSDAGVVSMEDSKRLLGLRLDEVNRALRDGEGELAVSRAKLRLLNPAAAAESSAQASTEQLPADAATYNQLLERLARLQQKEMELLATFTPESTPVRNIRDQITETRTLLGADFRAPQALGSTLGITNLQASARDEETRVAGLEARLEVLKRQQDETWTEIRKIEDLEGRINALERTREIQEANYKYFAKSLEQARIDDALSADKISNIGVIQPASFPLLKSRPTLLPDMGLSVLIGLLLGLAGAVFREAVLENSFKRPADVSRVLGVPMLLSVPRLGGSGNGARPGLSPLLPPARPGPEDLAARVAVQGRLREYHEALRDRVANEFGEPENEPCVLGVAAGSLGAGASTTASGLAYALARGGEERVLLVDAEPGRFSARSITAAGAAEPDEVSIDFGHPAAGSAKGRPAVPVPAATRGLSLNLVHRYQEVVREAGERGYRFVVFDFQPLGDTSPAFRIAPFLHGMIFVLEAEKDSRELARRTLDLMKKARVRKIGVVLNKTRPILPAWLDALV